MFRQFLAVLLVLFLLVDLILAQIPQGPNDGAGPQGPPPKKFLTLDGMSNMHVHLTCFV